MLRFLCRRNCDFLQKGAHDRSFVHHVSKAIHYQCKIDRTSDTFEKHFLATMCVMGGVMLQVYSKNKSNAKPVMRMSRSALDLSSIKIV